MLRRWIALFFALALVLVVKVHEFLSAPAFQTQLAPPPETSDFERPEPPPEPPLVRLVAAPEAVEEAPRPRPLVTQRVPTPALSRTLNVLLLGIDRRPGQKYGGRPDTIVVAALSKNDGHLGLISVPRDLYVEIPGHGMDRINATFSVAASRKEDSLRLLKRVLEDTLELPISHTLALDLSGFEKLIDSIGGVDVEVPCPILDNFIDDRTPSGRRPLDVDAGLQHLDGITASLYVRSRHGRSDFSRARRQQAVLFAVQRRFESIEGLSHLPDFLDTLGPLVTSDMSRTDLLALIQAASEIQLDHVHGMVLGAKQAAPHYTEEGKAVLVPNFEEIDRSLRELFSASTPGEHPAQMPCPDPDVALVRKIPRKIP